MNTTSASEVRGDAPRSEAKKGAGLLFIVSAPSGAGKSTLCRRLRQHFHDLAYSVSHTTRAPRPGEIHGSDYFFISREEFEAGIHAQRWAEWAQVHGNYYGTSALEIQGALTAGKIVLMDIDVQGTRQIKRRFPQSVAVFVMPPSLAELETRLRKRGSDGEQVIALRLKNALEEMAQKDFYDHVIVNDDLEEASSRLIGLVHQCRSTGEAAN